MKHSLFFVIPFLFISQDLRAGGDIDKEGFLTTKKAFVEFQTKDSIYQLKKNVLIINGAAISLARKKLNPNVRDWDVRSLFVKLKFKDTDVINEKKIPLKDREKAR